MSRRLRRAHFETFSSPFRCTGIRLLLIVRA
ncbi:hypothetical protein V525_01660 [Gordonia alkanivorans CGMCC 6845]|uniref:Uncharacterized protein n=1 Tax=Gordonia alkanivorans CGMCC 6845 TaxID=1423140 RepID=W9DHD2_9ACTN|nr:hypothetical protein V525_01660 [Gordonia alkanivorans CGMCC 6845]